MKILGYIIVFLGLATSGAFAADTKKVPVPTDSSTTVVNKLAAVYLIGEGRKSFDQGRIQDALRRFREAYVRDPYNPQTSLWIAEAHYQLDNYGYALTYGKIAESLSEATDGDVFYLLARAYHRQGYLDSARMNYDLAEIQLSALRRDAYNIKQSIREIEFAQSIENKETVYEKQLLQDNLNSGYDDYAALYTADGKGLYFVSRRPDTKGGGINPDDQRYFEDIYYTEWDEEYGEWKNPTNEIERMNTEGFDAIGYLSADGNTAYLTVNTSVLGIKNSTRSSDICISERRNEGRWSAPKPISNKSINTSFFDGVPTLTADENTMYFVSDRDGDRSKSDIYVVEKVGKSWGTAKKLPMNVNTKENETTPYITPDGKYLFFSSNGRTGMGGYDIYITENLGNGQWSDPINIGKDFNTVNDDIYFRYYPNLEKVTMSTYTVIGQKSSMDIYEVEVKDWDIFK